jgi:hypothetical protein
MDRSVGRGEGLGFSVTNTDAQARAPKGEGTLYCELHESAIFGRRLTFDGDADPSSPIFNGDKAEAKLANVECRSTRTAAPLSARCAVRWAN